jgi:Flp pilus assembly protein TadD
MDAADKEIEGLLLRAQALHEVGRLKESLALLHRVAALWPESNDVNVDIAEIYVDLGDCPQALVYTSKALRLEPEDGEAFRIRARALLRQNNLSDALDAARLAVRYQPDSPAPYATLSESLLRQGKHREAEEIAIRLLELFPGELSGHMMMGCVAGAQRRWAEAESHSRAVLQIDPTNWMGLNNLGVSLSAQGKKDEALEVFLQLAKLRPDFPNNFLNLSGFSPSDFSGPKYDSLQPEVRNLVRSKTKKRSLRRPSRRLLFLTVAIAPGLLYTLGAFLLPAATFSTWTLALVLWTALVCSAVILRVQTPTVWKFNTIVALIGLAIWFLSYITNVSGDALNYNSVINIIALAALLFVGITKRAIYSRGLAQHENPPA